jgi:diacylglycerol kinase family enzyme
MAGAGPDGALVYRMTHADKERLGRLAYYIRAATLFATHPFEWFNLEFVETGSRQRQTMRAVAVMAARVSDLGGLFRKLVGDGQVHHAHLQLIAIRPPAWLSLPAWFALSWLGLSRYNPMMRTMNVDEFDCIPIGKSRVHIQADGEWLGNAPMRVTLVPNAIRLLMRSLPMA